MPTKDTNGMLHDDKNGRFIGNDSENEPGNRTKDIRATVEEYQALSAEETKLKILGKTQTDKKIGKAGKNKEEFFGEEFKGYKGAEAIEKLLKEKRGHIKNAFERPEIGGIDLVWGDESGGLLHTISRRDKMLERGTGNISGIDMVNKIPEIIANGDFDIDERDRPGFNFNGYRVAIRPTYNGEKLNWIVSAMEKLQ